jgi:hypothetical protein
MQFRNKRTIQRSIHLSRGEAKRSRRRSEGVINREGRHPPSIPSASGGQAKANTKESDEWNFTARRRCPVGVWPRRKSWRLTTRRCGLRPRPHARPRAICRARCTHQGLNQTNRNPPNGSVAVPAKAGQRLRSVSVAHRPPPRSFLFVCFFYVPRGMLT